MAFPRQVKIVGRRVHGITCSRYRKILEILSMDWLSMADADGG